MRSWFRGCVDVQESGGGMLPLRFTNAQLAFFEGRPHKFRCYNSAGIRLDIRTDSPFVRMRYRVSLKPGTTERLHFDIFVDETLIGYEGDIFSGEGEGEWRAELPIRPGEPRRVTIHFPYLASVTVLELSLAEHAFCEAAEPYGRNLLCLGDSITQGMNAAHPSQTYAALIARQLRMNLLNQAVSGFVFHPGTIDPGLPYRPDLITVAYGTNDWSLCPSREQFEEQAGGLIGRLADLYPDTPIAVLSPIWRADLADNKPCGAFRDIHRTLERICSKREQIHCIDGLALTPHHPGCFADGLHPNDRGFLHMALELCRRLPEPFGRAEG